MAQDSNHIEEVTFYLFWKREYLRRNPEYIKAREELINFLRCNAEIKRLKELDEDIFFLVLELFQKGEIKQKLEEHKNRFGVDPRWDMIKAVFGNNPEKYGPLYGADEIFRKSLDNTWYDINGLGYDYDDEEHYGHDGIKYISFSNDYEPLITTYLRLQMGVKYILNPSASKISLEIDPTKPKNYIYNAVNYYIEQHKSVNSGDIKNVFEALYQAIIFYLKDKKIKKFVTTSHQTRAIGLWLWDYLDKNNLHGNRERALKAIRAFFVYFYKRDFTSAQHEKFKYHKYRRGLAIAIKEKEYDETGYRTFSDYLNKTYKCIEEMEVLPITSQKKKKARQ